MVLSVCSGQPQFCGFKVESRSSWKTEAQAKSANQITVIGKVGIGKLWGKNIRFEVTVLRLLCPLENFVEKIIEKCSELNGV